MMGDIVLSKYQQDILDYYNLHPHDNIFINALAGCVDCDTEFFNGKQWKRIADYVPGDKVLQFDNFHNASLVNPIQYHKYPCEELIHFETKYGLDQCLSLEHKVCYMWKDGRENNKIQQAPLFQIIEKHKKSKVGFSGCFLTTFYWSGPGIDLTDDEIKLMCAVICDGSFYSQAQESWDSYLTCRFHIKKERKKERLREIFKEGNFPWREKESACEVYTDFYVKAPRREKQFTSYWYNCNHHQLEIICDNILFWDGHENISDHGKTRKKFNSTIKETVDFVQFAFSACGKRAIVDCRDRRGEKKIANGKEYIRQSFDYGITISNTHSPLVGMTRRTDLGKKKVKFVPYKTLDGFKYCFTTPSGMWVMRRNGKICITGNSGKTFTLLTLLENTTTSDIYVAFNNSIAKEFQSKIKNPKLKAKTLHSVGYSIMQYNVGASSIEDTSSRIGFGKKPEAKKTGPTKVELDNLKSHKIVDELIDRYHGERCNFEFRVWLKNNYVQLYMLCRNTVTSFDNIYAIQNLIENYNIFNDEGDTPFYPPDINTISQWLQEIHRISTEQFNQFGKIDFADMLYITWEKLCSKEWSVPGWSYYTNIAFDELQDATTIQLYFIKFIKRKGGRYIFCGDSRQAIYYFASSNANNYEMAKKMFAPVKEFDLPICYRCPTSHLKRVNEEYNIPILPRDNAPEGFIKTIKNNEIKNYIQPGDMIISRKNKYLPEVILQMSIAGIPIYIEDKDFVDRVKKIAKKTKLNSLKSLENNINKSVNRAKENILNLETFQKETEGMTKEEQENLAQEKAESNSQVDSSLFLLKIIDSYLDKYPMASVEEFRAYLDKLLNTYPRPDAVRICSIHKAKGLEADNVFVLNEAKYEYLPFASPEQNQQEKNLSYIATTRAKNGLYLVKLSDLTQAKEDKKKAHSLEKILNKKKAQKEKGRK